MNSKADVIAKERQLRQLETFMDVVYALVLVLIFYDLQIAKSSPDQTLGSYVAATAGEFKLAAIGIVVTLVYWVQTMSYSAGCSRPITSIPASPSCRSA
jgi:hypothetical protein